MELKARTKRAHVSDDSNSDAGEPDRLSALPDCLLHTIMSFMKARQMVQTCVLSRRWGHLWRSAPCLDIDLDEFKTTTMGYDVPHNDRDWESFEDFAVNVMLRRNVALLDSFRLNVPRTKAPQSVRELTASWLRRAMKYCAPDPGIQREGLSSDSWRLKRLHLCNLFLDDRFAKHLSSLCLTLEDLELQDCKCEFHAITSHSLKNLVIKNCDCYELSDIMSPTLKSMVIDGSKGYGCLVVTAPAVVYLHLAVAVDEFHADFPVNEMPSLGKASIHLRGIGERVTNSKLDQFKLLCSVSNVTHLVLSGLGTMVLGEESAPFKEFKNLRSLLLDDCDLSDDFQTLTLFLESSPNLEKLTLRHCQFSNNSKRKKGTLKPKKTSSSQCQSLDVQCVNLKRTEIIYKDDDVRQLVELLLRVSGSLPKNHLKLTKVD